MQELRSWMNNHRGVTVTLKCKGAHIDITMENNYHEQIHCSLSRGLYDYIYLLLDDMYAKLKCARKLCKGVKRQIEEGR